MKIVYELSNDDLVRHNSINSDKISFDTHKEWFSNAICDDKIRFYLAFSSDDEFIGQIRFARQENFLWEVSMSIAKTYRGGDFL